MATFYSTEQYFCNIARLAKFYPVKTFSYYIQVYYVTYAILLKTPTYMYIYQYIKNSLPVQIESIEWLEGGRRAQREIPRTRGGGSESVASCPH